MIDSKKIKILLVEDEPYMIDMYKIKFEIAGYDVLVSDNEEDAIKTIRQDKPDIIILDIVMYGSKDIDNGEMIISSKTLTGFKILKKIKKDPEMKNIPVILLSNLAREEFAQKGIEMGAEKYILKSDTVPQKVIEITEQVLRDKNIK